MSFQPCHVIGRHSTEDCGLGMTGEGLTYQEIIRLRFLCLRCDSDLEAGFFYSDNIILALTQAHQLQRAFNVLEEIFKWVGLCINVGKTVSISFQPCRMIGRHSAEDCCLGMTGEGLTYQERTRLRLLCLRCDSDLEAGFLETHWEVYHLVSQGYLRETHPPPRFTQYIWDISPSWCMQHHISSGRMRGASHDPEFHPCTLFAPPRAGHASGTVGGEPSLPRCL